MFCAAFPVVSDRRFQEMSRGRADRTDGDLILVVLLPKTASREPRGQLNFHQSEFDEARDMRIAQGGVVAAGVRNDLEVASAPTRHCVVRGTGCELALDSG
jgi:hypothetical protein